MFAIGVSAVIVHFARASPSSTIVAMVGKPRPSATAEALSSLHEAEQKIISSLLSASQAFRSLSDPSSSTFQKHAESFVTDLSGAQTLIRKRITNIGADLPFENITMRRLIDADLALQRTAHLHRALVRTLVALDEMPNPPGSLSAAASPNWLPSPVAGTPKELRALAGTAPSPSPAGAPIIIAVPSPDAAGVGVPLSAAVALNSGVAPGAMEAEANQASEVPAQPEADAAERMEL